MTMRKLLRAAAAASAAAAQEETAGGRAGGLAGGRSVAVAVAPTPAATGPDAERHGHVDERVGGRVHDPHLRGRLELGGHAALDRLGQVSVVHARAHLAHQAHDHVERDSRVVALGCTAQHSAAQRALHRIVSF